LPGGLEPGQPVLSDEANRMGPVLVNTCARILAALGKEMPPTPPPPMTEEKEKPRLTILETEAKLDPVFSMLRTQFNLDLEQSARAAAVATGIVVHAVSKGFDHVKGFGVAVYGFVEGSKTVPVPGE
jgi:hypothetical protein